MLISRVLQPEEWHRLEGTDAAAVMGTLDPDNTRALVVEEDGKIVGVWLALRIVHAECVWVAPSHRGQLGVVKRLINGMYGLVRKWGANAFITGSMAPSITDIIERLGGQPMPCESFILPVREEV